MERNYHHEKNYYHEKEDIHWYNKPELDLPWRVTWNPVFNFVMDLKYTYMNTFYPNFFYKYKEGDNVIKYWADRLDKVGITKYNKVLKYVKVVKYGTQYLFKYDTLAAYNSNEFKSIDEFWSAYDGFYKECRGVVIDADKEELVIAPYSKFFNINEVEETMYDNVVSRINECKDRGIYPEFSEKLDGCIINISNDRDITLSIAASGSLGTFSDTNPVLPWVSYYITYNSNYYNMFKSPDNGKYTFMFECICPLENHVVNYTKDQHGLYLIGMRDNETGEVMSYHFIEEMAKKWNIKCTEIYEGYTLQDVMSKLDDKVGTEHEGFVMNINGFRVKLKYTDYLQLHHILYQTSGNDVIKLLYEDKLDDFESMLVTRKMNGLLELVKKIKNDVSEYIKLYNRVCQKYYTKIDELKKNDSISQFADIMKYIDGVRPIFIRGTLRNMVKGDTVDFGVELLVTHKSIKTNQISVLNYTQLTSRIMELSIVDDDMEGLFI